MQITRTTYPGVQAALDRCMVSITTLDTLTRTHTCYACFGDMIGPEGDYRPTIRCDEQTEPGVRAERIALANAYDAAREAQGDERRTYRG